jgi:hypothetical protein
MDETMTFTVKDVKEQNRGTRDDGSEWVKWIVTGTENGQVFGTFKSSWLLAIGDTVQADVRSREFNGRTYWDLVGDAPGTTAKTMKRVPAKVGAASGRSAAPSNAAGVQTALAQAPADVTAGLARLEAALELLIRRIDSMGAVLGDVAEGTRTITALLRRQWTVPPDGPEVEVDDPDDKDPGPLEPPDRDDGPEREPDA